MSADFSYDAILFFIACTKGDLEGAKKLVEEKKVNLKVTDGLDRSALHHAGHVDIIKWLAIECKMDPNTPDISGFTPLHWACMRGRLDVVKWLVTEAKADLYCKDKQGRAPLEFTDDLDIIEWLAPRMNKND